MKKSKIPSSIKVANKKFKVVQKDLNGKLGCLNTISNTIFIEKNQPEIGKMIILVHELIHLTDLMNVQEKVYKRRLTEAQVEGTAGVLSLILMSNKIINCFTNEDVKKFILGQ